MRVKGNQLPVEDCKRQQIVCKNQTADPVAAIPSSTRLCLYPIHIEDEEKWWQHKTSLSESNAQTMNGCDLTLPYFRNTTQKFHEDPGRMLSRGWQNMCRRLWHHPHGFSNFLESENLLCIATAGTKTALGIIQFGFDYLAAFFLRSDDLYFSR